MLWMDMLLEKGAFKNCYTVGEKDEVENIRNATAKSLVFADWQYDCFETPIPSLLSLKNCGIRAFHGLCDTVVDPIESLQMAKAVNMVGGHAELILFPTLAHNCWETVYSDGRNYDWLLSFTTNRGKTLVETLSGDHYGQQNRTNGRVAK